MANLHALVAHGKVTVDIYTDEDWNDCFSSYQALGKRLGFENAKIHTFVDKRTPEQKHPAAKHEVSKAKKGEH